MNDFTETVATPHSGRVGVPPPTVAADGDGTPSLPSFATAANGSTTATRADAEGGMSEEFRKCLKLERDRARSRRESAQGKFEAAMQSLDRLFDTFEDPSKAAAFSDGGRRWNAAPTGGSPRTARPTAGGSRPVATTNQKGTSHEQDQINEAVQGTGRRRVRDDADARRGEGVREEIKSPLRGFKWLNRRCAALNCFAQFKGRSPI